MKANDGMVQNYNRFLSDMTSQLEKADQEAQEKAATGQGKVIVSSGGDGTLDDAPNKEQVLNTMHKENILTSLAYV